jgi:hypothetical protein
MIRELRVRDRSPAAACACGTVWIATPHSPHFPESFYTDLWTGRRDAASVCKKKPSPQKTRRAPPGPRPSLPTEACVVFEGGGPQPAALAGSTTVIGRTVLASA